MNIVRGRVDDLSFFDCSRPFCLLFIEFHCTFAYLIKYFHIKLIIILFWLGNRDFIFSCSLHFFPYSHFSSYLLRLLILFHSCCSHGLVFGKTLVHEFPISYCRTEWYLLFHETRWFFTLKSRLSNTNYNNNYILIDTKINGRSEQTATNFSGLTFFAFIATSEISPQIIECKIFAPYDFLEMNSITIYAMVKSRCNSSRIHWLTSL